VVVTRRITQGARSHPPTWGNRRHARSSILIDPRDGGRRLATSAQTHPTSREGRNDRCDHSAGRRIARGSCGSGPGASARLREACRMRAIERCGALLHGCGMGG
jgi:hypothetical protein